MNALPDHMLVRAIARGAAVDRPVQPDAAVQAHAVRCPDPRRGRVHPHLRRAGVRPQGRAAGAREARGARAADLLQPRDSRGRVQDRLSVLPRGRPALRRRRDSLGGAVHGLPQDRGRAGQSRGPEAPRLLGAPRAHPVGAGVQGARAREVRAQEPHPGGAALPDLPWPRSRPWSRCRGA